MITPEQLAEIKHDMEKGDSLEPYFVLELIATIDRLQTALTAKDRVLSQFADNLNWLWVESHGKRVPGWIDATNPITLANQALSEGKE